MQSWKSVEEILQYAIEQEEEAAELYHNLARQSTKPGMRQLYEGFAREEYGHKAKLVAIKTEKLMDIGDNQLVDMKMADYLIEPVEGAESGYQAALIMAMKREKAAFRLYSDLAEKTSDASVKATLLALAQEEAKHKLRFEIEYDDAVQPEN